MSDWNPKIAVIGNGRVDKISKPLATTTLKFDVNPSSTRKYDVVIADTPDRDMFKEFLKSKIRRQTFLFRMRGDPFWGLDEWVESRVKRWLVNDFILPNVDGCLAIAPHQAQKYKEETGVTAQLVSLPKPVQNWQPVTHDSEKLNIVTLTNAVYWPKVKPLLKIAPLVNSVLNETGGVWKIGSWSDGYSDKMRNQLQEFNNIEFHQPLDAHTALESANVMIHYSRMDVLPNAVLEGMASKLPVITNDFSPFVESDAPILVMKSKEELRRTLTNLTNPKLRIEYGHEGRDYVATEHSMETIGQEFKSAIKYFHEQ